MPVKPVPCPGDSGGFKTSLRYRKLTTRRSSIRFSAHHPVDACGEYPFYGLQVLYRGAPVGLAGDVKDYQQLSPFFDKNLRC